MQLMISESIGAVSALISEAPSHRAVFAFAHGAGAGMHHPFMAEMTLRLVERGITVLRYQYPFVERGHRRPDSASVLEETSLAAIRFAQCELGSAPLIVGGKSMGGRITSRVVSRTPALIVAGLAFLGFPLHPPDRPDTLRATHLPAIAKPMLFLSGTRDKLARTPLLRAVCRDLGERATLYELEDVDHGFHILRRSGRTDADVLEELAQTMDQWCRSLSS